MTIIVIKVEIVGENSDGTRERIEDGRYELLDADGDRVERN